MSKGPNLNCPNRNWLNFNGPNGWGRSARSLRSTHTPAHLHGQPIRPFLNSAMLFLYLFNHFMYFSVKYGHSRNSAIRGIRPFEIFGNSDIPPLQLFGQLEFGQLEFGHYHYYRLKES